MGNLSWDVTWQDLKDHMRSAGDVVRADVMTEPDGRSKGCGLVEYASARDAAKAIQGLNDTVLKDRKIFVREDGEAEPVSRTAAASPKSNLIYSCMPHACICKCS